MGRGGQRKITVVTERKCLATGEVKPKPDLIRFVVGPDNQIVPDIMGKLPGRGLYVSAQRAALTKALTKGLLARAARRPGVRPGVRVEEGLIALIEEQLANRVVHLVALCRKAGLALGGFEKVKGALANDDVRVLLQASDGSERGKGKLWTPEGCRWFGCLTADELGLAFGREHVIHGAVLSGGLADTVVEETARLNGVRGISAGKAVNEDKGSDER